MNSGEEVSEVTALKLADALELILTDDDLWVECKKRLFDDFRRFDKHYIEAMKEFTEQVELSEEYRELHHQLMDDYANRELSYFDRDDVRVFITFCRESGGFKIC